MKAGEPHRVDTSWFPGQLSLTAELASGRWCGTMRTPYRTIDLDTITAVWYRSPRIFDFLALDSDLDVLG